MPNIPECRDPELGTLSESTPLICNGTTYGDNTLPMANGTACGENGTLISNGVPFGENTPLISKSTTCDKDRPPISSRIPCGENTILPGGGATSGLRPGTYNPVGSHHRRYEDMVRIGQEQMKQTKSKTERKKVMKCMSQVLKELEKEEESNWRLFSFSLFASISHIIGGGFTLSLIENWSILDGIYFCVVSSTTVGFGNIVPKTNSGRLFVIYYVLYSVALIIGFFTYVIGLIIDRQEELMLSVLSGRRRENNNVGGINDNEDEEERRKYEHFLLRWIPKEFIQAFHSIVFFFLNVGIGVYAFYSIEKLPLIDSIYATVISITTVGYGDYVATKESMKWFMIFWLIFSTVSVAKVIGDLTDGFIQRKQNNVNKRLLSATIDKTWFYQMDQDRSGTIDKAEYLTMMLIQCGKVKKDDIDHIMKRFHTLDENQSGFIEKHESFH